MSAAKGCRQRFRLRSEATAQPVRPTKVQPYQPLHLARLDLGVRAHPAVVANFHQARWQDVLRDRSHKLITGDALGDDAAALERTNRVTDDRKARCAFCECDNLQLIKETPKPSWSRVLDHFDRRCPWWHAEAEKQALIEYLDQEYGVDDETWYSVFYLESAREPPRLRPPTQLTLPGFDFSRDFVSESF